MKRHIKSEKKSEKDASFIKEQQNKKTWKIYSLPSPFLLTKQQNNENILQFI